eukprot:EST47009.1 CTP synthase [Spironucleus salmonicida]
MKWLVISSDERSSSKTVVSAYIAALLDRNSIQINYIKLNPALSVKLGLLSPESVGEAYVTYDGGQVDKDIGIIERSVSYALPGRSCLTLGQAIDIVNVTELGSKTCGYDFLSIDQHLRDYVYQYITNFKDHVINVIELGGSIKETGVQIFCQAIKKLHELSDITTIHIGDSINDFERVFSTQPELFINYTENAKFMKNRQLTKALETQLHSHLENYLKVKLADFDLQLTYLAPLDKQIYPQTIRIAIVGRYVANDSGYLSIIDNVRAAAHNNSVGLELHKVQSLYLNDQNVTSNLQHMHGIIVPGGFGNCGLEGKICAIKFARENRIPLLAICYGFQMTVIEYARNVCGMDGADTFEIDQNCKYPLIDKLTKILQTEQRKDGEQYGVMNLGDCKVKVKEGTIASTCFNENDAERHWHSYAVNMKYWDQVEKGGLIGSIRNEAGNLVVGVEIKDHPFFFASQFHPEFRAKYSCPHEIFIKFIAAGKKQDAAQQGKSVKE